MESCKPPSPPRPTPKSCLPPTYDPRPAPTATPTLRLTFLTPSPPPAPPYLPRLTLQESTPPTLSPLPNPTHRGRGVTPLFPWQPIGRSLLLQAALFYFFFLSILSPLPHPSPAPPNWVKEGRRAGGWREREVIHSSLHSLFFFFKFHFLFSSFLINSKIISLFCYCCTHNPSVLSSSSHPSYLPLWDGMSI